MVQLEVLLYDNENEMRHRKTAEHSHKSHLSRHAYMLAYVVCALLASPASAIWPFTQKRFKNSLIDSGSMGVDGNGRIIAFGDFNSDQLCV